MYLKHSLAKLAVLGMMSCLLSPSPLKAEDQSPILTLGSIDGETINDTSTVSVRFDKKPHWNNVAIEDHGTFIQIQLPDTINLTPGTFYDIDSPFIKKAATLQLTPKIAAVRLFVNKDAALIKKAMTADILDNRVLVTLDHKNIALDAKESEATSITGVPSAAAVIAKTEVDHSIPEPAKLIKQELNQDNKTDSDSQAPFDFKQKLTSVAIFIAILLFGATILMMLRPLLRKRSLKNLEESYVSIKTLAVHALAPKQKLTLVKVGDEQILVGVSPDNISYITTLPKKVERRATLEAYEPSYKALPKNEKNLTTTDNLTKKTPAQKIPKTEKKAPDHNLPEQYQQQPKAIDDITKMIREKLKNLPSV